MPITVTFPLPGANYGPGQEIAVSSNFIGPLGQPQWHVLVSKQPLGDQVITDQFFSFVALQQLLTLGLPAQSPMRPNQYSAPAGANVHLVVNLEDQASGNPIQEQTDVPIVWEPTSNLGVVIQQNAGGTTGGGFTQQDRQLLTDTNQATALPISLDTFTTASLPIDPNTGFGAAQLPTGIWGVIIRITQIPPDLHPITPDDDYFSPTLCVVRIFRGSDLWIRVPVHTSSRFISIWDQNIVTAVTQATATQWLLNMSIQVTFKPGVLGTALLTIFP